MSPWDMPRKVTPGPAVAGLAAFNSDLAVSKHLHLIRRDRMQVTRTASLHVAASFSDDELDAVMAWASALPPPAREGFLQLVAGKLAGIPPAARGPDPVHRVAAEVQRGFLRSGPIAVGGKYR